MRRVQYVQARIGEPGSCKDDSDEEEADRASDGAAATSGEKEPRSFQPNVASRSAVVEGTAVPS